VRRRHLAMHPLQVTVFVILRNTGSSAALAYAIEWVDAMMCILRSFA